MKEGQAAAAFDDLLMQVDTIEDRSQWLGMCQSPKLTQSISFVAIFLRKVELAQNTNDELIRAAYKAILFPTLLHLCASQIS